MSTTRRWFVPTVSIVVALAVLAACAPPPPELPEASISVDPSIQGTLTELPGFEDGAPRPVAVVTGQNGVPATFVADEVWLQTDDEAELNAFLARWNGTVLLSIDPAELEIDDMPAQYLIRVETSAADTAALSANLRTLDTFATGDHKVSSEAGLNLIAASSQEAAAGLAVGMNWVGQGSQFLDFSTTEAPTGATMGGLPYTPNSFLWPTHSVSGVQEIGVAQAWRALEMAGKLNNKVKLAILDMGFQPDLDTPAGWLAISNVPLKSPTGTENLLSCGDNDCPWHGQMVLNAAMAVADNNFGTAGAAGAVATPIIVYTLYDFFTSIQALASARIAGAKIANMSYSAPVPWYLGWSVIPFETATIAFRLSGMLLFASAGNDGQDVDSEECTLGVCWERTWHTPCENGGVICVGGLASNSLFRAGGSNYGFDQVDIFAPYVFWIGPDPDNLANTNRVINGTSFSSPYTAGIAALIWAANPGLSAGAVEDALINTAHPNGDGSVRRHVNALGAVMSVLGNVPPVLTAPGNNTVLLNQTAYLSVTIVDLEDPFPCCAVTWSSNVDGPLGTGWQTETVFTTLGPRTITVSATDSGGATSTASFVLTVENEAPEVIITRPASDANVFRTAQTILRGQASDRSEPGEVVSCDDLSWSSSVDGPLGIGCQITTAFASNGPRTITLTATDSQGLSSTDTVQITVVDPPANLPPLVNISSPTHHQNVMPNQLINLTGTGADPEAGTPLTYLWTVQLFGQAEIAVGNAASVQWRPSDNYNFGAAGTYTVTIRLYVTDPDDQIGVDSVELEWVIIL